MNGDPKKIKKKDAKKLQVNENNRILNGLVDEITIKLPVYDIEFQIA